MRSLKLALEIVNSGSPNDLPCKGGASECYLSIGYVTAGNPHQMVRKTFCVNKVCNGATYLSFEDLETKATVSEIQMADDVVGFMVTLSFYWGTRQIDAAFADLVSKFVGVAFEQLLPAVPAAIAGAGITDALNSLENSIVSKIKQRLTTDVVTIAVESFDASVLTGVPATLMLASDQDITVADFVSDTRTTIHAGDLAAKLTIG